MTYISVSVISLLIIPKANLIVSLAYTSVFGIYPIVKLYIEKIKNMKIEYIIKFLIWNIHLFLVYVILSAFGQNSLFDLGTFWVWLGGMGLMLAYDLIFGIFINGFYRTYSKFLK